MCRSIVRLVAHLSSRTAVDASFPQKVTALTAAGEPDIARSARQTACSKALGRAAQHIRRPTRAHPLHLRSTLLHFTCARDDTHSSAACAWPSSRRSRSIVHVPLHWQSAGGTCRWFLCSVGKNVTAGCSTRHTQRKNVSHLVRM